MCVAISEREFANSNYSMASFSGYLANRVVGFANGPDDREMSCMEMLGRRVAAELCYALLCVTALIETVVRLAMTLIAVLLVSLFVDDGAKSLKIFALTSLQYGIDAALRCFMALGHNLKCNKVDYKDLGLCQMSLWV